MSDDAILERFRAAGATPQALDRLVSFFLELAPPGETQAASPFSTVLGPLTEGHGQPAQRAAALMRVCECLGEPACRTVDLHHSDGVHSTVAVLVGPAAAVVDPTYGGGPWAGADGRWLTLDELVADSSPVAAGGGWRGRDGRAADGFFRPKGEPAAATAPVGSSAPAEPVRPRAPDPVLLAAPARPTRPTLLLLADVPGWAFHTNLREMAQAIDASFECVLAFCDDIAQQRVRLDMTGFDLVYAPHYMFLETWPDTPWDRATSSLRTEWFRPADAALKLEPAHVQTVNRFLAFHVVTRRAMQKVGHLKHVSYLTNPVEMARFPHPTERYDEVICEWNGNAAHGGDIKGVPIVQQACARAEVPLRMASFRGYGIPAERSYEEMPAFYTEASVALCASQYEGASNSVMEAMASGLVLIATDVGNHVEMHENQLRKWGRSGILLVGRKPDAFVAAIEQVKAMTPDERFQLGRMNRREIAERWSWAAWAPAYKEFFMGALRRRMRR